MKREDRVRIPEPVPFTRVWFNGRMPVSKTVAVLVRI